MEAGSRIPNSHVLVYMGLSVGIFLIVYTTLHANLPWSILIAAMPLSLLGFLFLLKNPYSAFVLFFILNYAIMGIIRYFPGLLGGIAMDALVILIFLGIFIQSLTKELRWDILRNGLIVAVSVWFIFCILTILNPLAPIQAWIIGIRRTAFYLFTVPILTCLLLDNYKKLRLILILWSVFVLLSVMKVLMQRYIGFDPGEIRWLYVEGNVKTHIIYSGIRYFSFFSDAANYGCGMAVAMVFYSILALYTKKKILRVYFIIVALSAAYGMLMSGTRVAIVIPFVGYSLFAVLTKNVKIITAGAIVVIGAFIFLNYTNYLQGNSYIRRMRTAFHPEQDASFLVRVENQRIMRAYLADKPLGVGIGTAKAAEYSTSEISKIPTDSWLVMVWVETGIVGLVLYLSIIVYIIGRGIFIVMFKIKNREIQTIAGGFLSAILGLYVASYANEVVAQFPNGPIIYMGMALVFMAEHYDRQITEQNPVKLPINGKNT
ncbi:MAG: O-antigen ligase family protein [Mangrovibacterium sp.]